MDDTDSPMADNEGPSAPDEVGDADVAETDRLGSDSPRPLWKRWWVITIVVLLVLYTIPALFTASPEACGLICHQMRPYYESWNGSRHRAAASDCLYCHAKPGFIDRAIYRPSLGFDILASVTNGVVQPYGNAEVDDDACMRSGCHGLNRKVSLGGAIRSDHRAHIEKAEMACVDCHAGAGHGDLGGRSSNPPMDSCRECHAKEMENCQYCHLKRVLPQKQGK